MLSNTLRLNFCYLKTFHIFHPRYHPEIMGHILKNKQRNKYLCIHEIIRLIILRMKMKMKKDYIDTTKTDLGHGHKYSNKYKKCLTMMILICVKKHLSNTWCSTHDKAKQHWGWPEKKCRLLKKSVYCNLTKHSS